MVLRILRIVSRRIVGWGKFPTSKWPTSARPSSSAVRVPAAATSTAKPKFANLLPMAWCYQIALECGSADPSLPANAAKLQSLCALVNGAFFSQHADDRGNVWICLNISHTVIEEAEWKVISAPVWREVVAQLNFRFGFCGLEVEQVHTYAELLEDPPVWSAFEAVALSTAVWQALDCPAGFVAAREGMVVWTGESDTSE